METRTISLPTLTSGLSRYLAEIRRFPLLTQEEESHLRPKLARAR
jgi:hypothetical protein